MPFQKRTVTFDFGAVGAPEFSCTIRDPKTLTEGEMRALQMAAAGADADEDKALAALSQFIEGWDIKDEEGNPIPFVKGDPRSFDQLPLEAIEIITQRLREGTAPNPR